MSINAYKSTLRELETPRQIERRILTSLTARMETVADKFDTAESSYERLMILATGLRSALAENQKFWSTLKYDLMESNNALPDDLRARLSVLGSYGRLRQWHRRARPGLGRDRRRHFRSRPDSPDRRSIFP